MNANELIAEARRIADSDTGPCPAATPQSGTVTFQGSHDGVNWVAIHPSTLGVAEFEHKRAITPWLTFKRQVPSTAPIAPPVDWSRWLPPKPLPDTGDKPFKTGQIVAWRGSSLGEVVEMINDNGRGRVLASSGHSGGHTSTLHHYGPTILIQDVGQPEPTPPDVLWARVYAPVPSPGVAPTTCDKFQHRGTDPCGNACRYLSWVGVGQGPESAPALPVPTQRPGFAKPLSSSVEPPQSFLCHQCRLGDACSHSKPPREPFIPKVDEWDLLPDV